MQSLWFWYYLTSAVENYMPFGKKSKNKQTNKALVMLLGPDGEEILNHETPSKCVARTAHHKLGL